MNFRGAIAGSLLTLMIVSASSLTAHAQAPFPQPASGRDTAAQPAQDTHSFSGPSFRKGLWRFIRTLDVVRTANKNFKYRVVNAETTRCVDPTFAMKATFSPEPIGSCVSDKPEKVGNRYTFGHRCDYMGTVSTVITVRSDEAYTELNEVSTGENPRTDTVVATRIGDCDDGGAANSEKSAPARLQH
ncbi:hypothetical protein FBZ93_118115 [Bradyrhizobium macuxiense]|uniref:DUF3617 family protein n=2 Tax=Bradyrhizobium macuxiense TaxID=1755647 RepID=A0A560KYW1_9BRAD|nr:DUF3617 family protein [Bradyrhizobium macuxiense]TWB88435.1 hypothetical protein FBZ93_118115 [Bradyrhizobium macuxiense]